MKWLKRLLSGKSASERQSPDNGTMPSPPPAPTPATAPVPDAAPEFPFPLVAVRGVMAEREWKRYNALWRNEGASAVLIGDRKGVEQMREAMSFSEKSPAEIIAAANELTAESFMATRRSEYEADEMMDEEGEWPAGEVVPCYLTSHTDIVSNIPKPWVFVAKIPTIRPWEIPAYLKFGGWNDCPAPEAQVSLLKYWTEKYGIEVFAITGDVMECVVARPPTTREAALALAREQFLFCSDIVHQGTQTIATLAATLEDADAWYFWWD
jgi:hypothetical protein